MSSCNICNYNTPTSTRTPVYNFMEAKLGKEGMLVLLKTDIEFEYIGFGDNPKEKYIIPTWSIGIPGRANIPLGHNSYTMFRSGMIILIDDAMYDKTIKFLDSDLNPVYPKMLMMRFDQ